MATAAKGVVSVVQKSYPAVGGGLSTTWVTGKKHQLPEINKPNTSEFSKKFAVFKYRQDEYCKVGLLKHDTLADDEFPMAKLAKKRMTDEQQAAAHYRVNRAILMSNLKRNLPEDEWTPIDAEHLYLDDVIAQLEVEEFEKKLMKAAQNDYDDNWERLLLIPFRLWNYNKIMKTRREMAERFSQSAV